MEDLTALVELFNLKIVSEYPDLLCTLGNIPNIAVQGKTPSKIVVIGKVRNAFWATERIPNVPMRIFGHGEWGYIIDI